MKMTKRFLGMMLSLCLLLGLIPGTAFAVDSNLPFTDVNTTDWFYDSVQYVYENEMMGGTSAITFSPSSSTTRGMVVTILHRLEGSPSASGASFSDIPDGYWCKDAVSWASANGIVNGYENGTFGPQNAITREQFATILYRYSQCKGYNLTAATDISGFADADKVGSFAATAMGWAVASRLITGMRNNTLAPKGTTTRAQAATILTRYCKNVVNAASTQTIRPGNAAYTVTFDLNYDGSAQPSVKHVKAGETVNKPSTPARGGYSFGGWYTESSGGTRFDFNQEITSDLTLYAHWSKTTASSSDSDNSSSSSSSSGSGSSGNQPRMNIQITNDGYNEEYSSLVTQENSVTLTGVVNGASASSLTAVYAGYEKDSASASVSGTNSWTANIPLEIGTNTVTIKAEGAGASAEKVVYINRTSSEITYKETVKVADEEDYQTIADGTVDCWVDDNNTPNDDTDDVIVMLVKDSSLLMSQINRGLLNQGEVYMIPQNDIFLTGFTGVYNGHRAPRGTEDYPLGSYPDSEYEELIFDFPGFDDLFAEDVSLDFSGGINPEDPLAFAVLADGTPIDLDGENSYGISLLANDNDYPKAGWQWQELLKNIGPNIKCEVDQYNNINFGLEWGSSVIYDEDGKRNKDGDESGQIKLSGNVGLNDISFTGNMEWHPDLNPLNFKILPDQAILKMNYTFGGEIEVTNHVAGLTTEGFVQSMNDDFENKGEFGNKWVRLTLSGTDTFKDKVTLVTLGFKLSKGIIPTPHRSIKGQQIDSGLEPLAIIYIFFNADGELTAETSVTLSYEQETEKGFNIQRNGYTGAYGSQAQNRSEIHRDLGSNHTLDIYDKNEKTVKFVFGGKTEASIDAGIGAGCCIMIGGVAPASIDGDVFLRARGTMETEAGPGIQFYPQKDWDVEPSVYADAYMGLGTQADFASKLLIKAKKHNITAFDFDKHWEHMFWEKNFLSTSKLDGTVYVSDADDDNTNNLKIAGAKVTLIKQDTQRQWTAQTSADGKYVITGIPDGKYTIKVEKSGYDTYTNDDLIFSKGQTLDVFLNPQAQNPNSGICGDNLTWVMDVENGVLTISGTGTMYDYHYGWDDEKTDAPWSDFNVQKVVIEEGVSSIGGAAFAFLELTDISIPNSVTTIGNYAFCHCEGLMSVTIPDGVTTIGAGAFSECDNLTSVTIPDGVTSIAFYMFANSRNLTSVSIPDGVTSIGEWAFEGCGLTNIAIPDSVTSIGEGAFYWCDLTSVVIPDGVTIINNQTFQSCFHLSSVTIPDGVTSIGSQAFLNCNLTNVTIPDSVTTIGENTFSRCRHMTSVTILGSVTSIGDSAFKDCDSLTDVYYVGSEEQWNQIQISDNNEDLIFAEIHYNSTESKTNAHEALYLSDGENGIVPTEQWKAGIAEESDAPLPMA